MTPPLTALVEALIDAPNLSKYHGIRGFEVERYIADYERWMDRRRAALSAFEAEPQGVEALRTAIAEALFLYNQAEDERRRGKKAWGKEHAEWRADAVCLELQRLGLLPLPLPPEMKE